MAALVWLIGCLLGHASRLGAEDADGLDLHGHYLKLMQQAEEAMKAGKYRQAWTTAELFCAKGGYEDVREKAKVLIEKLEKRAADILEEGEKHWWYREYPEAEKQYRLLFEECPHSRVFTRARARLISLRFMPAVASKKLLAAAQAKEAEKKFEDAARRYLEVITLYPDTPAAIHAQHALTAMREDPEKRDAMAGEAQAILQRELDTKWQLAANYLKDPPQDAGDWLLYDRGVTYLHEIIALAPDSPQAAKARRRIHDEQERIETEARDRQQGREKGADETGAKSARK